MKIRTGFVSNSSSASFIIDREFLSLSQEAELIRYDRDTENNHDGWSVYLSDDLRFIKGFTSMDNGSLEEFLKEISLDRYKDNFIEWADNSG